MNHVLIVEDETYTAVPVKEALEMGDTLADIAPDGKTALEMFRQNNYDLILLDLGLPGMTGDEVLKAIREEDPFITVIVYSNYRDFEDSKKLINLGIDGYINKGPDVELDEIVNTVEAKLSPMDTPQGNADARGEGG